MRLYLLELGFVPAYDSPIPGYLIQTDDGRNVLVDSGYPRALIDRGPEMADELATAFQGDAVLTDDAEIIRRMRRDPQDLVVERLAAIGLAPRDVDYLVATHFDWDHAGNHDLFPGAEIVVQREHLDAAQTLPRLRAFEAPWDSPSLSFRLVDGDVELLPGIELIASGGHVPGHQSVLVRLPETGPVLLAADAIADQTQLDSAVAASGADEDPEAKRASVRKLQSLAEREGVTLIVFGHDGAQWRTLKKSPEYYS